MQRVWGGDGDGIIGGAQDDTAWASGRGDMELENFGHGGRSTDVQHGLLDQGRPVDMPSGGMTRTRGNKDSNTGKFHAPPCPGHPGHFGGWKHPSPTVPLMRNSGTLAYTERKAPYHRTVRQGSGEEFEP